MYLYITPCTFYLTPCKLEIVLKETIKPSNLNKNAHTNIASFDYTRRCQCLDKTPRDKSEESIKLSTIVVTILEAVLCMNEATEQQMNKYL